MAYKAIKFASVELEKEHQPELLFFKAKAHMQLGQFELAFESASLAHRVQPEQPQIHILACEAAIHAGHIVEANQLVLSLAQNPPSLLAKDNYKLATLLHKLNFENLAHDFYHKAWQQQPNNVQFTYSYGVSLRNLGKMKQAEASLNNLCQARLLHSEAWLARSLLRKASNQTTHSDEIQEQLNNPGLSVKDRIRLSFARAKELEDCNELEAAALLLKQANKLQKQQLSYQVKNDELTMDTLAEVFHKHQNVSSLNSEPPIFIVGLPRSGTTLVERLLTQSAEVSSAGELHHLSVLMSKQVFAHNKPLADKQAFIQQSATLDMDTLGQTYLKSIAPHGQGKRYVIDKMPTNFLNIGLIKRALPNARIIHVSRNARDSAFALYKTLFEQAGPYSYCPSDLKNYIKAHEKLMAHWYQLYGDDIHQVKYEELVAQPDEVCRRLFEHCQLSWQREFISLTSFRLGLCHRQCQSGPSAHISKFSQQMAKGQAMAA